MIKYEKPITHETLPALIESIKKEGSLIKKRKIAKSIVGVVCPLLFLALSLLFVCYGLYILGTLDPQTAKTFVGDLGAKVAPYFDKSWEWYGYVIAIALPLYAIPLVFSIIVALLFIPVKCTYTLPENPQEHMDELKKAVSTLGTDSYNLRYGRGLTGMCNIIFPIATVAAFFYVFLATVSFKSLLVSGLIGATVVAVLAIVILFFLYKLFATISISLCSRPFRKKTNSYLVHSALEDYETLLKEEAETARVQALADKIAHGVSLLRDGKNEEAAKILEEPVGEDIYDAEFALFLCEQQYIDELSVNSKLDLYKQIKDKLSDAESKELKDFAKGILNKLSASLTTLAEADYAKGIELFNSGDNIRAMAHLKMASVIGYKDGTAAYALAKLIGENDPADYRELYNDLGTALDEGVSDAEIEQMCRSYRKKIQGCWAEDDRNRRAAADEAAERTRRNVICRYYQNGVCTKKSTSYTLEHCYRDDGTWLICPDYKNRVGL